VGSKPFGPLRLAVSNVSVSDAIATVESTGTAAVAQGAPHMGARSRGGARILGARILQQFLCRLSALCCVSCDIAGLFVLAVRGGTRDAEVVGGLAAFVRAGAICHYTQSIAFICYIIVLLLLILFNRLSQIEVSEK